MNRPPVQLDHVALLVRSIELTSERLGQLDTTSGPIEAFPKEGTRERYLGPPARPGRLLLIEPSDADGPYARAMRKRGPGLHHVAFRTAGIDAFLEAYPGWLLHPISLQTRPTCGTIWLARPGVPFLLEVFESPEVLSAAPLITSIELPIPPEHAALTTSLGLQSGPGTLTCGECVIDLAECASW